MFRRILNIRYLFYKAKICFKLLFIGLNIPFLFIKLHVFSPQKKRIKGVAIVLPKPLGLGDLSMISPVFELLEKYKPLVVLSNCDNFFENAPEWKTYSDLKDLFKDAKKLATAGYLLYIPKSSIKSLSFVQRNMELPIIAAISENIVIDTMKQKIFRLSKNIGYTQKAISMIRFLTDTTNNRVHRKLKLIEGAMSEKVNKFIKNNEGDRIIVLAPYAKWKARRWGQYKWSQLINKLQEQGNFSFIIIGAQSERYYGEEIIGQVSRRQSVLNAMGEAAIPQLRSVFELAELLICVDNGPMHLGISCGVKTIAVFGCTPYEKRIAEHENAVAIHSYSSCSLAPCYTGYVEVLCPYECQCIRDVKVEDVVKFIV